jgi:hypothetical protein
MIPAETNGSAKRSGDISLGAPDRLDAEHFKAILGNGTRTLEIKSGSGGPLAYLQRSEAAVAAGAWSGSAV